MILSDITLPILWLNTQGLVTVANCLIGSLKIVVLLSQIISGPFNPEDTHQAILYVVLFFVGRLFSLFEVPETAADTIENRCYGPLEISGVAFAIRLLLGRI